MKTNEKIQTPDIIVNFLYAKDVYGEHGKFVGFTRLDKILYLLTKTKEFSNRIDCEWYDDNYGPFSADLYDTLQALIISGVVVVNSERKARNLIDVADEVFVEREVVDVTIPNWKDYPIQEYKLSNRIMEFAKQQFSKLSQKQRNKLTIFKIKYGLMNLGSLFALIYLKQKEEKGRVHVYPVKEETP